MWTTNPEAIKIPTRADALDSWFLPMLSRSFRADEEERAALDLYNAVKRMGDKATNG